METKIQKLNEMIAVQCSDGNFNFNSYMHGMANGMIFARSILTGEEPQYIEAPKEWLSDRGDGGDGGITPEGWG